MSIRGRTLLLLLLISAVPAAGVGLMAVHRAERALVEQIGVGSLEATALAMTRINEYLGERVREVRAWSRRLPGPGTNAQANEAEGAPSAQVLADIVAEHQEYAYMATLGPDGLIQAASQPDLIGQDVRAAKGLAIALDGQEAFGHPAETPLTKKKMMTIWVPVWASTAHSRVATVLVAAIDWETIHRMVTALKVQGRPQNAANHFMLLDAQGLVISCFDRKEMFSTNVVRAGLRSARLATEGKRGYLMERSEHGDQSLIAFMHQGPLPGLPALDWQLLLEQDADQVLLPVAVVRRATLLMVILVAAALILASFVISSRLARPIRTVAAAARTLGGGDLSKRLQVAANDDVGALMQAFNTMAADLQRSHEQLNEARAFADSITDSMMDMVFVVTADGTIERANQAAASALGYRLEELTGKDLLRLAGRDPQGKQPLASDPAAMATSSSLRRQDGTEVPVSICVSKVPSEVDGRGHFVCVARDETERKRAEADRARLVQAVEHAGETIVITDADGTIQYANPSFERTTGYSPEEAIGSNPRILKSGQHDQQFYRELWETVLGGQVWTGRLVNRRKDGSCYQEVATISPVRSDNGEVVHLVAVKRDVTKELALEAQVQQAHRLETVGTLAGGIAHDVNNLLAVVLGNASLLERQLQGDGEAVAMVEDIVTAAHKGGVLAKNLLGFARGGDYLRDSVDLNEAIEETTSLLRCTIPKRIALETDLAPDLAPVAGDPRQLSQIVMNLITNAADAIDGAGAISVSTRNITLEANAEGLTLEPGDYVRVCVVDNGCGMDANTQRRAFDPFFTTKEVGEGSGLGLAMVYGVVGKHGGQVTIDSKPGHGTTIIVRLPTAGPADVDREAAVRTAPIRKRTGHILVVDDERRFAAMTQRLLGRLGYSAQLANSGESALHQYSRGPEVDLVVLDIEMPGMDGIECFRRLRTLDAEVRVVLCSGHTARQETKQLLSEGLAGFLLKPFDLHQLSEAVTAALGDHTLRSTAQLQ